MLKYSNNLITSVYLTVLKIKQLFGHMGHSLPVLSSSSHSTVLCALCGFMPMC